jgi:predicted acylesterase/phospholipase RssA
MSYNIQTRDEHLANNGTPKRILALDGGGLRGILTVAILQKIEDLLRKRHGVSGDFRLCHYFDLIAGTSTGSIIAAALAKGWTVEQIRQKYMALGESVFEKSWLRQGLLRAKYDESRLIEELKSVYGENTTLGSPELKTGLLVVTKRLDTGSPWPVSNNPRGKYYADSKDGSIGNSVYPLWQVVRASTAAPSYFDSQSITITDNVQGEFIDGGASPFNNPALQAFMYCTLDGYRIDWPTGADKLLLVSVGSGTADPEVKKSQVAAKHAINALVSLMDDCASLQETLLQWMSTSTTAREIDSEIGDLSHDLVAAAPLLSYLRYNVNLRKDSLQKLDPTLTDDELIESLSAMDAPENMSLLHKLGTLAAEQQVRDDDFAAKFDLLIN